MTKGESAFLFSLLTLRPAKVVAGPARDIWVLSETRLRAEEVKRQVRSEDHHIQSTDSPDPGISDSAWISTRSEVFSYLSHAACRIRSDKQHHEMQRHEILSRRAAIDFLVRLLREEREDFPILFEEFTSLDHALEAENVFLGRLLGYFDKIRAFCLTGGNYSKFIDELGNSSAENARAGEEYLLYSRYQERLRENSLFDSLSALEEALSLCRSGEIFRLPKILVLDKPWMVQPLEAEIVEALSRYTSLHLLSDDKQILGALQSKLHLFSSVYFENERRDRFRELWALSVGSGEPFSSTFETDTATDLCGFSGRESEVKAILQVVSQALSQVGPEGLHLVTADLDPYRELLISGASNLGVPLEIRKPQALRHSICGKMFLAFLEWLERPSEQTLSSLQSYPLSHRRDGESHDEPIGDFAQAQSVSKTLLRLFRRQRQPLRTFRAQFLEEPQKLEEFLQGLRAIRRLVHEATKVDAFLRPPNNQDISALQRFARVVTAMLETALLPQREDAETVSEKVSVTELLDVRGISGRHVIFFGCSQTFFPRAKGPSGGIQSGFQHSTARRTEAIGRHPGFLNKVEEERLLFSHLLSTSKELWVTYPEDIGGQESAVSAEILPLARLPLGQRKLRVLSLENTGEQQRSLDSPESVRIRNLLIARRNPNFSEFDGDLRQSRIPLRDSVRLRHSVSDLEESANCRHRTFFRRVLQLALKEPEGIHRLHIDFGTLVHQALYRFFLKVGDRREILNEDFSLACRMMYEAGEAAILESSRSWDSEPSEIFFREQLLLGLSEADEASRAGILLGFLRYQKRLIQTWPVLLEWKTNLRIETEMGAVRVNATLDRFDESSDGQVTAVYDYKFALIPKPTDQALGKSLQMPLYAEAIRQNRPPYELPRFGGFIDLRKPNRSEGDLLDTTSGVVQERLSLIKSGRSYVSDPSGPSENVQNSLEKVRTLVAQLSEGDFRQQLDTKYCENCDFRSICARDEVLLKRKIEPERRGTGALTPQTSISPRIQRNRLFLPERPHADFLLSPEQERSSDISRSLALRAGAGSGKTLVLRTRYLRLILAGERVDSIVAITFTERAATEIRERIESGIYSALASNAFSGKPLTVMERERLRLASLEIGGAHIGTIHSLARKIVETAPDLAGLSPFLHIISGSERRDLLRQIIKSLGASKTEESSETREAFLRLLRAGVSVSAIERQIERFVGEPREFDLVLETIRREGERGRILPFLRRKRSERILLEAEILGEFLKNWTRDCSLWLSSTPTAKSLDEDKRALWGEILKNTADCAARIVREENFESYFELCALVQSHASLQQRKSTKNPRNFFLELRNDLDDRKSRISILSRQIEAEGEALSLVLEVARLVFAARSEFRRLKAERRSVDFNDLISGANTLLSLEREGIREQRRRRIVERVRSEVRHLLVDEFQDTDAEQWALLRAMFSSGDLKNKLHETTEHPNSVSPSLFLVGDNQQAIYSFRGGDVRVFESASKELEAAGGTRTALEDNYRSAKGVLEFCNQFFELLFRVDFDEQEKPLVGEAVSFQKLRFAKTKEAVETNTEESRVRLFVPRDDTQKGESGEAEQVVSLIAEILQDREQGFLKWPALKSVPKAGSIAVLTRQRKHLRLIRSVLDERGIAYRLGHNSGFFELEEIQTLLLLARVVIDPSDEISLIGLLRSPFAGLSDADLLRLRESFEGAWSKTLEEGFPAQEFSGVLASLRAARAGLALSPVSLVLRRLLETSAMLEVYDQLSPSARDNIYRFLARLEEAERRLPGGGSPAEVLHWLASLSDESAPASGGGGEEPVVLLTVHSAKGLEFPAVILPFLRPQSSQGYDFLLGELPDLSPEPSFLLGLRLEAEENDFHREKTFLQLLIEDASKSRKSSEERRLFYVAATRAREYLFISQPQDPDKKEENSAAYSLREINLRAFLSEKPAEWLALLGGDILDNLLPPLGPKSA